MPFTIEVASVSDRESLVVEIWNDSELISELRKEDDDSVIIDIYPNPGMEFTRLKFDEFIEALLSAKKKLHII